MLPNKRNSRGELRSRKSIVKKGRGGAESNRGRGKYQSRRSGSARRARNQSVVVPQQEPEDHQQEREDPQQQLELMPREEPEPAINNQGNNAQENVVDQEEAGCSVGPQENRRRRHRPNCPLYRNHPNYQRRHRELIPEPAVEETTQPWSISALVRGIVDYVSGSLSPRTRTREESSRSAESEDVGEEEELSDSQLGTEATSEASNKSTSSRSTGHGSGEESHIDSDSESSDFDI